MSGTPASSSVAAYKLGVRLAQLQCLVAHFLPRKDPLNSAMPWVLPKVHEQTQVKFAFDSLRGAAEPFREAWGGERERILSVALSRCEATWEAFLAKYKNHDLYKQLIRDLDSVAATPREFFCPTEAIDSIFGKWFGLGHTLAFGEPVTEDDEPARDSSGLVYWQNFSSKQIRRRMEELEVESSLLVPEVQLTPEVKHLVAVSSEYVPSVVPDRKRPLELARPDAFSKGRRLKKRQ